MNAVDSLLGCSFTQKTFEEKKAIVAACRPKPKLEHLIEIYKHANRRFSVAKYEKYDWLTGSELKNRMFCWTCLLFSNERTGPRVKEGINSLSSFCKKAKVHANSSAHMKATIPASIFGERRIDMMLGEQCRANISAHNRIVEKNRKTLWKLIKIVCWLEKQEIASRGNDESIGSKNLGNYRELLVHTAQLDPELQAHIDSSKVFKGVSSHIQNNSISSVACSLREIIKDEIRMSPFVPILAGETTDISCKAQFFLVYCYIFSGNVQ